MFLFNLNSGNHKKPKYNIAKHSQLKTNSLLLVYSRSSDAIMDIIIIISNNNNKKLLFKLNFKFFI